MLRKRSPMLLICAALLFCAEVRPFQAPKQSPAEQKKVPASTIRIGVGLVQTDVTVFDKQGRFVDDLKADQFQLLVDGKPHPIDFFDQVTEGGPATGTARVKATQTASTSSGNIPVPPDTGRNLFFFIDDFHLSAESMMRTRTALLKLIDESLGVNDRAAIFTASRQLGFLQQLTDNKAVLRLAVARLGFSSETPRDYARPVMNEAQAAAIEMGDPDVNGYFVEQTIAVMGVERTMAQEIVRGRAASLARISSEITVRTLNSLGNIVNSCAAMPGRKLVYFLSDGFVVHQQKEDIMYRLRLVAEAAARAAIVIYTLDTRGLVVGLRDVTSPPADPFGRLDRGFSEVLVAQDGLNALAADTGGRFYKNTNALDTAIITGAEEGTRYYLLGWHVDPDLLTPGKYSRIRITLVDRPDLKVNMRQSAMDLSKLLSKSQPKPGKPAAAKPAPNDELVQAVQFPWPIGELPISLYAGYYYDPQKGYILDACFQIDLEGAESGAGMGKSDRIDIMGVVFNREGVNVDRFKDSIGQSTDPLMQGQPGKATFAAIRMVALDPGIYQVRVAARDPRSGRLGSAHQWVDVPRVDLTPAPNRKILLGSIFLKRGKTDGIPETRLFRGLFNEQQFSAERMFTPGRLPFSVQIYNVAGPSVLLQARIYRGNQVVLQPPAQPIAIDSVAGDTPLFVESNVSLEGLPAGSYVLELTASDAATKAVARQQVIFSIGARP